MNTTNSIRIAAIAATMMVVLPVLGATTASADPMLTVPGQDKHTVLGDCPPDDNGCVDDTPWG